MHTKYSRFWSVLLIHAIPHNAMLKVVGVALRKNIVMSLCKVELVCIKVCLSVFREW